MAEILADFHSSHQEALRVIESISEADLGNPKQFEWLPDSCAYRRLANGQDLPGWHPLITGDPESVHEAGVSIKGKAVSENETKLFRVLREVSTFK